MDDLFHLPSWTLLFRVTVRFVVAVILGGLLGLEREREGKSAGLRTHMLVALGSALFTVASLEAGMSLSDLSRVFQGIAAGIGFIGAGTILKRKDEDQIKGLTTAAGLWLTGAVGVAAGAGLLWIPVAGVVLALIILSAVVRLEKRIKS